MSNPQLTPLQAKHIVEAQSHYEQAIKVLKEATEALTRAEANLENATGDRAPFEADVREKKQSVADATVRVRYERECLTRLLDIKPPKPWSYISFITGGEAPYTYEITFAPNEPLEAVTPTQSNQGLVRKDILIPNVEEETKVTYTVTVKDKNGEEISSDGNTITLKPGPAPGDAVPSDESIPDDAEQPG